MASETGQRVGDYEILTLLGSGGMGRVYKVRNVISNREEAMKILLPDFASEPELAARFMAEIRTLGGLEHPNIAQLRTAFQLQNHFVMIMELVEGTTLDNLPAQAEIQLDRVLDYSMQVLAALSYAHGKGVIHRDIKPANIMITSHGVVKLMDFGIAKSANDMNLTRPGTTMGSVYYICPEQVRGGTVDARSDIYSFGVTLYEMLTGRKPFQADTSFSVLNAQLNEAPMPPVQVNPALPRELNDIVLRAMAKDPEARFQTAEDFRNALKGLREPKGAAAAAVAAMAAPAMVNLGFTPADGPLSATTVGQGFGPVGAVSATGAGQGFTPVAGQGFTPVAGQGFTPVAAAAPASTPNGGFAAVAATGAAARPAQARSHRGLWIGLGALAAVLALVAAAIVLPHFFLTHAGQQTATTGTSAQTAAASTDSGAAAQPSAATPDATGPGAAAGSGVAGAAVSAPGGGSAEPGSGGKKPRPGASAGMQAATGGSAPAPVAGPGPAGASAAPAGPSPQEIREAHDRMISLGARADAAVNGVEHIRSQQQAAGYDIRGDILASMSRMHGFLHEADQALNQHDVQAANEYMDRADREVSTLNAFLGH